MTTSRAANAGASAQAEFERREASHDARIARDRSRIALTALAVVAAALVLMLVGPGWWLFGLVLAIAAVIGGIATLVTRPGHVAAWSVGAGGERETAAYLAELEGSGYRALHDRRIPGSRATIDHIVVGPTGVFVIETTSRSGGRRDRVIEQVHREADAVAVAIPCVQVTPIVCVQRADLPLRPQVADGVPIVNARGLLRRLREGPAHLSPADIDRLIGHLDARLPSAT